MKYIYTENVYKTILIKNLIPIFKKNLSRKPNLFLKINDVISHRPLIDGTYEPHLKNLYSSLSHDGFNDYFIDIGANVGLSSILVYNDFRKFYLFEPNPLIFKVLEVNSALNFNENSYSLFNYGLGNKDETLSIAIPKNNWGGAFIISNDNHYDQSLLTGKDGFKKIDNENYIKLKAKIKNTKNEISELFSLIKKDGGKNGIIKIDVEGFEEVVLQGIASVIPNDFSLVIIFENWNKKFDIHNTTKAFGDRVEAFKLHRDSKKSWPKLIKAIFLLLGGKYIYSLKELKSESDIVGDLVYYIKRI